MHSIMHCHPVVRVRACTNNCSPREAKCMYNNNNNTVIISDLPSTATSGRAVQEHALFWYMEIKWPANMLRTLQQRYLCTHTRTGTHKHTHTQTHHTHTHKQLTNTGLEGKGPPPPASALGSQCGQGGVVHGAVPRSAPGQPAGGAFGRVLHVRVCVGVVHAWCGQGGVAHGVVPKSALGCI